jgi:hypothetical protein
MNEIAGRYHQYSIQITIFFFFLLIPNELSAFGPDGNNGYKRFGLWALGF